ncbi:MAG: hypothetical protein WBW99_00950 [Pseudolabrys sp.]
MKRYFVILAVTLFASGAAHARDLTAVQWKEMNANYQAAYLEGLLSAVTEFGVTEHLREPIKVGMECLVKRRWTAWQIAEHFNRFLEGRSDLNKQPLPMALLDYLLEECETK